MMEEKIIEKQDEIIGNENKLKPMVSIIIVTYNSSKYVLETLESAKAQTYQNIELIVSDDCSTDNTVEVCKSWIEANKDCFVRSEIICTEKNTGIPANCNRGLKHAKGEWVKYIAGDDILEKECIASFVNFCLSEPKARIVESISQFFNDDFLSENFTSTQNFGNKLFFHLNATPNQQYQILLRKNLIHGPTVFINRETLNSVGGFDESNRFMEDHPLWLKMTKQGHKVFFLKEITVFYRMHSSSVYASFSKNKIFSDFYSKRRSSDLKHIYPNIGFFERLLKHMQYYRISLMDNIGFNRNDLFFKIIYKIWFRLSPYNIYKNRKIKSIERQINFNDKT